MTMGNDPSTSDNRPQSLEDCIKEDEKLELPMRGEYWDRQMEESAARYKRELGKCVLV